MTGFLSRCLLIECTCMQEHVVFGANVTQTQAVEELQKASHPEPFHRMADHLLRIAGNKAHLDMMLMWCPLLPRQAIVRLRVLCHVHLQVLACVLCSLQRKFDSCTNIPHGCSYL